MKSLHLEGYDGRDGARFVALASLEALGLARGSLASLGPLRQCAAMRSLTLTHLRSLTDVSELRHLPGL
ncbi:hypothetical protein [Ideonella sp. A 288]|uniref:hypothetical protein n=1 Tax=Ideonella sp. A 288 TaxID=1962181 RepID=UPI0018FEAECA|nr:hypothetical protein [Ideonella sp. A 288]